VPYAGVALGVERPPALRWLAGDALVSVALRPALSTPRTAAISVLREDVPVGTPLRAHPAAKRRGPAGAVATREGEGVAATHGGGGDPVVGALSPDVSVPEGWIVGEGPIPGGAGPGSPAAGVILELDKPPLEFPAMVVTGPGSDPLDDRSGTLAVPP